MNKRETSTLNTDRGYPDTKKCFNPFNVREVMAETEQDTLPIERGRCERRGYRVRKLLEGLDGVEVRDVKIIELGVAEVEHDPSVISKGQLATAVGKAGFELKS